MANLAQFEPIKQKIRMASTTATTALHRFIFEEEGDRKNRQRLRDFRGFTFQKDTPEYIQKLEFTRRLTIGDLISCCNILGLEYDGSKEEIITRILDGLTDLNTLAPACNDGNTEEEKDEEIEEDGDKENENLREKEHSTREVSQLCMKFSMTYRDVEDSIRIFSGKDAYPIERWINDFEDAADLFEWTELQKIVFAKKSLTGPAKMLVESEDVIKTWKKLKAILQDEFSDKVNSAQVHVNQEEIKKRRTVTRVLFGNERN